MTFLFHTHLARDYPDRIEGLIRDYPEHRFPVAHDREELLELVAEADVLVDYRVTPALLDAATLLKWVFVPFSGVNMLPLALLKEHGIQVSNNHGNSSLVAERALALALSLMGRVAEFDRGMRRGHWYRNQGKSEPFQFWESLSGRKVSILGLGAIGRGIAGHLAPFRCEVTGFRRSQSKESLPGFHRITTELDEALKSAELCFVTLPLTDDTRALLGTAELEILEGAYLVNVSRGAVVDEAALYEALASGKLRGAGLDVWHRHPEPFHADRLPSEWPFHELENVVLSPHAGSHAPGGKSGQMDGVVQNIISLVGTGMPRDVVDSDSGY